jgi:hypothetical protein
LQKLRLGEYTPTPSERLFSRRSAKGKILLRQYREFFKMKKRLGEIWLPVDRLVTASCAIVDCFS